MIYAQPFGIRLIPDVAPLQTTALFAKIDSCEKRIIVIQGGGDAGKTSTVLQWLSYKSIQNPHTQTTIVGESIPNLKRGAIRLYKRYIQRDRQIAPFLKIYIQSDKEQFYNNGSSVIFASFENNEENARGAENDYVFMNEANLMSYNLFWELQRKCRKKIIIDYNPTFAFWAHNKLINGGEKQFADQVQLFIVNHSHNPFLTLDQHLNYENISDPERYKVYALGLTGQTTGVIFKFKKITELPKFYGVNEQGEKVERVLDFGFGIDIGYTNDKTTIVKVYMNGKDHYYQELLYKSNDEIQNEINEQGLLDDINMPLTVEKYIARILFDNGMQISTLIFGDHDKNMSGKLRRARVPYRMAKKGPNSEVASISSVKRFNGYYFDSPNLENELNTYKWETAVDILTGNEITTGQPVEGMPDHCIAAIRYFEHSFAMRFSG